MSTGHAFGANRSEPDFSFKDIRLKQNALTGFAAQNLARASRLSFLTLMMLGTLGVLGPQVHGQDGDGDGFDSSVDCDDTDPNVYPGAFDILCNGIDEDCDGADAGPCITAVETVRLGVPANPNALLPGQTSPPIVGQIWDPVIDHTTFAPTAVIDYLAFTLSGTNVPLTSFGTLLCQLPFVTGCVPTPPGVPFTVPIPDDLQLAGLDVCTQGMSIDAQGTVLLTNALDTTIGTIAGPGGPVEYQVQVTNLFFVNNVVSGLLLLVASEWLESDEVSLAITITGINGGFHEHGDQIELVQDAQVIAIRRGDALIRVDWFADDIPTHSPETYTACVQAFVDSAPFGVENCEAFGAF